MGAAAADGLAVLWSDRPPPVPGTDLFSARTFFPHWEHVYMLSPSSVSLMVTSSRDS